ncbi:MAG: alpha/beta hydrolase [Deltaproteobacteria bacterium]|nr:alpha/beta hydrolase [Deltaproteobacteria bacterium]
MVWEFSEKGIVFFPDPYLIGTPADYGLEYEEVVFPAEDGVRLHGWWVPQAGAPTFLWFHGNAGNISHRLENIKLLHDLTGVQVFIFDYREYGKSQGRISREGTFKDALAAYRYVTEARNVPAEEVILFGRSLGTALATDLAVKHPCGALILEAPFTNSQDMAKLYAPFLFDWRPKVPYDNIGKIGQVTVPVMVIHGARDEVIPVDMGRRVFEAAPEPKELYVIPGAHHNDTYNVGGPQYFARLKGFIERFVRRYGTDKK